MEDYVNFLNLHFSNKGQRGDRENMWNNERMMMRTKEIKGADIWSFNKYPNHLKILSKCRFFLVDSEWEWVAVFLNFFSAANVES